MTVVFVSAMASGCVTEPDVSTRTQGVVEGNAIAANAIAANAIAANAIAANAISEDVYLIAANNLMDTTERRELLKYVVGCAIPAGVTLVGTHAGVTYEFHGDIGLAPRWIKRSLRETEERWVSACLLSRVNRFGVSVTISIRGPHKALKVSEPEAEDYSVEEGAFYGNVFRGANEPLVWNACRGRDEVTGESGDLDLRDCAERDPSNPGFTLCGFKYAGDCDDWAPPKNAYACKKFRKAPKSHGHDDDDLHGDDDDEDDDDRSGSSYSGGYYEDCHDAPGLGKWPNAERFKEVITVFVAP